ncbi:hypothetical protein [Lactobacillus bombicola]|nr:hypothetical protein [Lactobacillus bombicola]
MKKEKIKVMPLSTYSLKRKRLHLRNPKIFPKLTDTESMVMRAAVSQGKGKKYGLSLTYIRDNNGNLVEAFVIR